MGSVWQRLRRQRGFTLIELLAVMAIIAILAAIVAPAVSGTKDTSVQSQAAQDGLQVRTAANDFFSDQNAVEVLETEVVTSTGVALATNAEDGTTFVSSESDSSTTTISATEKKSSRWPEKFITASATSTSIYHIEFALGSLASTDDINETWVLDFDDKIIGGENLLKNYTAINADILKDGKDANSDGDFIDDGETKPGYLETKPKSFDLTVDLGGTKVHQLIWLFKKTKSPDSSTDDGREVRVFKLSEAKKVTVIQGGTLPSLTRYDLMYRRVF